MCVFYFNDCHNFRESLERKIVEFSASSWQLVDLQRWQTRDLKQLQIANGACHNGPQTGSAGMTLLLCTHSLRCCWPKGRTYFRNDIWDWRLETGLETGYAAGLSGNYATDLVRGMRGANLSEVEAVFCCYSSLLFLLFFGQQMLKASDRFFDILIYGTSSSAWVDEVATCIDLQLASTSVRGYFHCHPPLACVLIAFAGLTHFKPIKGGPLSAADKKTALFSFDYAIKIWSLRRDHKLAKQRQRI